MALRCARGERGDRGDPRGPAQRAADRARAGCWPGSSRAAALRSAAAAGRRRRRTRRDLDAADARPGRRSACAPSSPTSASARPPRPPSRDGARCRGTRRPRSTSGAARQPRRRRRGRRAGAARGYARPRRRASCRCRREEVDARRAPRREAALDLAQPLVPVLRRLTAPAARRYVAGWFGRDEVHVLAPRVLEGRASNVPGSREMQLLAPAALYVQLVVAPRNPRLPPPFRPPVARALPDVGMAAGRARGSGCRGRSSTRGAIVRRLREGPAPAFPPGLADAGLLGGTVLDLLAREEGWDAVGRLAAGAGRERGRASALERGLRRARAAHTEGTWRAHLARRLAPTSSMPTHATRPRARRGRGPTTTSRSSRRAAGRFRRRGGPGARTPRRAARPAAAPRARPRHPTRARARRAARRRACRARRSRRVRLSMLGMPSSSSTPWISSASAWLRARATRHERRPRCTAAGPCARARGGPGAPPRARRRRRRRAASRRPGRSARRRRRCAPQHGQTSAASAIRRPRLDLGDAAVVDPEVRAPPARRRPGRRSATPRPASRAAKFTSVCDGYGAERVCEW